MEALDTEVRNLLQAKRGDWQDIAKRADVSHSWLSKFVNGRIANPGYGTLKRLHDVLVPSVHDTGERRRASDLLPGDMQPGSV